MNQNLNTAEQKLRAYLSALALQVGERLPGERELADALGVGRTVLRPALDALALAGIVERRPQSGTFLTALPAPHVGGVWIALIVPFAGTGTPGAWETEPAWLHRVVSAFERVVVPAGARLRLMDQSPLIDDPCSVKTLTRAAIAYGAGAVVLIHPQGTKATIGHALALIHDAGVCPVIVSARDYPGLASQVYFDSTWGAYLATRYLLDRGHQRIGFAGAASGHEWVRERVQGWRNALGAAEVDDASPWLFYPDDGTPSERLPDIADGAQALDAFLATTPNERPTAILAANDIVARGLLGAANERGVAIPGDLSLIGFDNDPGALLAGLTTVERPTEALGEATARTTLERLAAGSQAATVTLRLRPLILERKTVAVLASREIDKVKQISNAAGRKKETK